MSPWPSIPQLAHELECGHRGGRERRRIAVALAPVGILCLDRRLEHEDVDDGSRIEGPSEGHCAAIPVRRGSHALTVGICTPVLTAPARGLEVLRHQLKFCLLQGLLCSSLRQVSTPTRRPSDHLTANLSDFRPLNETELDRLDSDALIAYIREAHAAGRPDDGTRGLSVLVFRHYDDVCRRVSIKVPRPDIEDVAMSVVTSAIKSAFDGSAVGQ